MPIMEFHAPYDSAFLPYEITAYMLFPKSSSKRSAYLAKKMAEYTLKQSQDGSHLIPAEILQDLLENSTAGAPEITEHIVKQACVAAEIFLNLVKLHCSGEDASVNKAIFLGDNFFEHAQNKAKGKISSSESSIRRAWTAYTPSAHLWAAYIIINTAEHNSESYLRQLSIATELVKIAPKVSSKNAKEPRFSSDELWTIPDFVKLPECSFLCSGLNAAERGRLPDYEKRSVSKHEK